MSANLIVDLGGTAQALPSILPVNAFPGSGAVIGNIVDMLHSDTFCNLQVAGALSQSGQLRIAVQTADVTTSGTFTDPTSGLAQLPTDFASGGILWINSGGGILFSGFIRHAGFQRPHRYARAIFLSGDLWQAVGGAGFVSQFKTTGSGGGYTYAPGSGTPSV